MNVQTNCPPTDDGYFPTSDLAVLVCIGCWCYVPRGVRNMHRQRCSLEVKVEERCSTCGSDRRGEKRIKVGRMSFVRTLQGDGEPCPDKYHDTRAAGGFVVVGAEGKELIEALADLTKDGA